MVFSTSARMTVKSIITTKTEANKEKVEEYKYDDETNLGISENLKQRLDAALDTIKSGRTGSYKLVLFDIFFLF